MSDAAAPRETGPSVRTKLIIDTILFVGFVVVSAPHATGVPLHEWLSFAFCGVFVTHLLMSWRWVTAVLRRFVSKLGLETRVNAMWDALIYLWMILVIVSGVMASEVALPLVVAGWERDMFWRWLHHEASELLLPLVGIHLALHARWIVAALRRKSGAST